MQMDQEMPQLEPSNNTAEAVKGSKIEEHKHIGN